jgi:hypothetical protein
MAHCLLIQLARPKRFNPNNGKQMKTTSLVAIAFFAVSFTNCGVLKKDQQASSEESES